MSDHFKNPAYNALHRALLDCTREQMEGKPKTSYDNPSSWLAEIGQATLAIRLVDKLNELGYEIVRRDERRLDVETQDDH